MAANNTKRSPRGRTSSGQPNPIDVHVGSRVRLRRALLGMTQEDLGKALGLTFQQVQKYERGENRIGSSRLYDLARILDVPVGFFFDDMPEQASEQSPRAFALGQIVVESPLPKEPAGKIETLQLVRAYYAIQDPNLRKKVYELAKALAEVDRG